MSVKEEEQSAKTELWKCLATQLSQSNPHSRNEGDGHRKQDQQPLKKRPHLFGCSGKQFSPVRQKRLATYQKESNEFIFSV